MHFEVRILKQLLLFVPFCTNLYLFVEISLSYELCYKPHIPLDDMISLPSALLLLSLLSLSLQTSLKILNTPDQPTGHTGDCRKPLLCSGVSLHFSTIHPVYSWWDSTFYRGRVAKRVDMSECGFVSNAVVTATARTRKGSAGTCPAIYTSRVNVREFNVYSVEELSAKEIGKVNCDVHWIATGYTDCD